MNRSRRGAGRLLQTSISIVAAAILLTCGRAEAQVDIRNNQVGRLTSTGNSGTHTYNQYDAQGRVIATQVVQDGDSRIFRAQFGYPQDPGSAVGPGTVIVQETLIDGERIVYTYDLSGQQSSIRSSLGTRSNDVLRGQWINARGQITRMDLGNGTVTNLTYDDGGHQRLRRTQTVAPSGVIIQDYSYTYDGNGNLKSVTDGVRPDQSVVYEYDSLDQLISVSTPQGSVLESYDYDAVGNLTRKGAMVQEYGVEGRPHALKASAGATYRYDANGNVTTIGSHTTIDWNAENMPRRVVAGSSVAEKSYVGESLWKKVEDGVTTYYLPSIRIENGGVRKYYGRYAERLESGDGQLRFYHPDHLGSSAVMTDRDANVIRRVSYWPWGQDRGVARELPEVFTPKLQFNFKEKDASGFYDYGARLYNPVTGRWLSPDSTVADGLNRYSYARNNPTSRVDPDGHTSDYIWIRYGDWISLWPRNEALPKGWWKVENNFDGYHKVILDGKLSRLYPDGTMAHELDNGRVVNVSARPAEGDHRAALERISSSEAQVGADVEATLLIGEIFREFNHGKRLAIFMKTAIEGALHFGRFLFRNGDEIITLGIEGAPSFDTNAITILGGMDATREYVSQHGGNRLDWGRWSPEVNQDYMYGVLRSSRGEALVLPTGGPITQWERTVLEAAKWKRISHPHGDLYVRQPDSIIPPVLPKFPPR